MTSLARPTTPPPRERRASSADSPGRTKAKKILRQSTNPSHMCHTAEALTIAVLGASGDLAKKKTYPSLLKLYLSGYLPSHCAIIGFARSDYSDESLEALTIPRMIPSCGHTFCEDCLSARLASSPREAGQQPGSSFATFRSSLASGDPLARAAESSLATSDLLALVEMSNGFSVYADL